MSLSLGIRNVSPNPFRLQTLPQLKEGSYVLGDTFQRGPIPTCNQFGPLNLKAWIIDIVLPAHGTALQASPVQKKSYHNFFFNSDPSCLQPLPPPTSFSGPQFRPYHDHANHSNIYFK